MRPYPARHEGRDRRPVLLVVLGGRRRARGAAGRGAAPARRRDAHDHRQRPARQLHARAAPALGAPRHAAAGRHPGRPLGDRARERVAAEHRALAARDRAGITRARERALRRAAPPRADDAGDLRRRARAREGPGRRDLPCARRPRLDEARACRCGASSSTGSTTASPSPPHARDTANSWLPGDYEIIPNGVLIPSDGRPARPRAPDRLRRAAGAAQGAARAAPRMAGDPPAHRRAAAHRRRRSARSSAAAAPRERVSDEGIDILGFLSQDELTAELLRAKALVAPSLGGESFGMVLTRAFACATPVVASDIDGYRDVMTKETGVSLPPGDERALTEAVVDLLEDEPRRAALGDGRARASRSSATPGTTSARRLVEIYEQASRRVVSLASQTRWVRGPRSWPCSASSGASRCSGGAGRRGARSATRSRPSSGAGSPPRSRSTCSRSSLRALAWRTVIVQAFDAAVPALHARLLGLLASACFANAVLPGRIGELARVAVLNRRMPPAQGAWATLARHRLRAPRLRPRRGDRC